MSLPLRLLLVVPLALVASQLLAAEATRRPVSKTYAVDRSKLDGEFTQILKLCPNLRPASPGSLRFLRSSLYAGVSGIVARKTNVWTVETISWSSADGCRRTTAALAPAVGAQLDAALADTALFRSRQIEADNHCRSYLEMTHPVRRDSIALDTCDDAKITGVMKLLGTH